LTRFAQQATESLYEEDPVLSNLLESEYHRQANVLAMVASSSLEHPSVLACQGVILTNVTAEGYPGKRYHGGCHYVDEVEQLAIERAKHAFGAQYANVQPHCASSANEIIMCRLLNPGDTLLGMGLESGGHLTHGAKVSFSGRYANAIEYGLDDCGLIDYDQVLRLARQHRPRLIICGTTAYPRTIDFKRFRAIADEVGAFLLADMTHIAGLVAAGLHPSPIDEAHFTTTCTHKQLYGPRGGLILIGRDAETIIPGTKQTLASMVQSAVFPFFQGSPAPNIIAGKARGLARVATREFHTLAARIVADAKAVAAALIQAGQRVISGGTDNHIVLVDVSPQGLSGIAAQRALEDCNIIVNKNKIPGDKKPATITSGIRLGTNTLACREFGPEEMKECASLLDIVLRSTKPLTEFEYQLDERVCRSVQSAVTELCRRFPLPYAPFAGRVLRPAVAPGDELVESQSL
jgi:glycine hydroxymethyltransferase